MLDLHAHILPGIDDGPATLADALALLDAMAADGVQHVVATPHIYPGVYDNTYEGIQATFDTLRREAAAREVPMTFSWAAEVRLCVEMLEWFQDGRLPTYSRGSSGVPGVLLELPDGSIPLGADKLVGKLVQLGLQPLIAHPERNRAVMEDVGRVEALRSRGAKLQVTAASLLGEFGERAEAAAHELLKRGWVDVVASDAHNLRGRRPRMQAAREWLTQHHGAAVAERLTETNPATLAGVGSIAVETPLGWALRDLPTPPDAVPTRPSDEPNRAPAPELSGTPSVAARQPGLAGFELVDWHASALPEVAVDLTASARALSTPPSGVVVGAAFGGVPLTDSADDGVAALSESRGAFTAENMRLDLPGFDLPLNRPSAAPSLNLDDLSFATPLQAGDTWAVVPPGDVIDQPSAGQAAPPSTAGAAPAQAAQVAPPQATTVPSTRPVPVAAVATSPVVSVPARQPTAPAARPPARQLVDLPRVAVPREGAPASTALDLLGELQRVQAAMKVPRGRGGGQVLGFVPSREFEDTQPRDPTDGQPPAGRRRAG